MSGPSPALLATVAGDGLLIAWAAWELWSLRRNRKEKPSEPDSGAPRAPADSDQNAGHAEG